MILYGYLHTHLHNFADKLGCLSCPLHFQYVAAGYVCGICTVATTVGGPVMNLELYIGSDQGFALVDGNTFTKRRHNFRKSTRVHHTVYIDPSVV